jgi:hypothetical protein
MVQKVTRWSPDTCDCVIEYSWDDAVPQEQRVHTVSRIVQKCSTHAKLGLSDAHHFAHVLAENQRKNQASGAG